MKYKVDIILAIITFFAGASIIYFVPNGKNGYQFIPLFIYWTIRYFRRKSREKKDLERSSEKTV